MKFSNEDVDLIDQLKPEGYYDFRKIENEGVCCLCDFIFTTAILVDLNEIGYDRRYCFHTKEEARMAFDKWTEGQPHPPGNWIKMKV